MKNVVELNEIADAVCVLAKSITDPATVAGNCPSGQGYVNSLTEAVMGNTAGLVRIADAITYLADTLDRVLGDAIGRD